MKRTISVVFTTMAALAALPFAAPALAAGPAADSAPMRLDLRESPRLAADGETFALSYSPRWGGAASCSITADGARLLSNATDEGTLPWTARGVGRHALSFSAGALAYEAVFSVPGDDVVLHGGVLAAGETWAADRTHLVTAPFTVPGGVTLTIEPGTVVKFMDGTSLTVASGGACIACGVIFTHVADDTAGGDTLCDGEGAVATPGRYAITGVVTDDDSTEYRYLPPQTLTSSISSDTRLRGHRCYIVSNSVTIASGATLTLQPGTVLKFNTGCQLTVNGTLDARGTRASPIVFTSIKDDTWGGDTNGDASDSYANYGDWEGICNNGGTLNLTRAKVLYGGYGQYIDSNDAVILSTGGATLLDCCEIKHTNFRLLNAQGGVIKAVNCILQDGRWGIVGNVSFLNGVIADCGTLGSSGGSVTNAIYWNCGTYSSGTKVGKSIAYGYTQSVQSGITYANPLFVDPDNGDFRVAGNSPCVDAGDGMVAPETDFYGRPRMDVVKVENMGTANADGVCPDIGIFECDGTTAVDPADLAVVGHVALNVPGGEVHPGDTITVTYVVTNCGSSVNASWRDVVKLVSEYGSEVAIASVMSAAKLGKGEGVKRFEHVVRIPAVSEGDWRVKVDVNPFRDVYERSDTDNNSATSEETIIVTMTSAALDAESTGSVTSASPFVKKFTVPDGGAYALRIAAPNGATVSYGIGAMPSSGEAHSVATVAADGYAYVSLPAGSTVYVEVSGGKGGAVTMTPFETNMTVLSVSPSTLPQSGEVTLTVAGLHFDSGCTVSLKECGRDVLVASESVRVESAESLTAKFDCAKLTAGTTYDLVVATDAGGSQSSATATLPSAVTVSGVKGAAKLEAKLDMPSSLRAGRSFVFYIDYANTGNADMPAPIFTVKSDEMTFDTDYTTYTNSVKVIGLGAEGSAGVLKPGESFRMAVKARVKSTVGATDSVSYSLNASWVGLSDVDKKLPLCLFFSDDWTYWHGEDDQEEYDAIAVKMGATWGDFYRNLGGYLTDMDAYGLATTDYEQMSQSFAWHCVTEAKEEDGECETVSANVKPNMAANRIRLQGADSVLIDLDGETPLSYSYLETRGSHWAAATSSAGLRKRIEEHHAELAKDNSNIGDVWIYGADGAPGKWMRLIRDDGAVSKWFDKSKETVLICHGNLHSVHTPWVADMAKAWKGKRDVNVLAVDWGDAATAEWRENEEFIKARVHRWWVNPVKFFTGIAAGGLQLTWPERAFATAIAIPTVSEIAYGHLTNAVSDSTSLTIIGHSHGSHVGGNIAGLYSRNGSGRVGRLIGLETSSFTSHQYVSDDAKFPNSWNRGCALISEFYKTSYWMSVGSFGTDKPEQVWGAYNFMLVGTYDGNRKIHRDYFEHQWLLDFRANPLDLLTNFLWEQNADNAEGRFGAVRHDSVEEWFIDTIDNVDHKWDNLGFNFATGQTPYQAASNLGIPNDLAGNYIERYHGVINVYDGRLELAQPKEFKGSWRYREQILDRRREKGTRSPALDDLQDNVTQAIEYRIPDETVTVPDEIDEKNHKISFTVTNAADNLSVNYKDVEKFWMRSRNEAHAPWQKDIGIGVWLCRPYETSAADVDKWTGKGIEELRNGNLKWLRIKNWKIENLERFTQPLQRSVRQFSLNVPPKFGTYKIDSKEGEDFLLVVGVGVSSEGSDDNAPVDYFGDLCQTNNFFVKKVRVKPTQSAVIVINGNEYEDGDTANILVDEKQTSVPLSISAQSMVEGVYDHDWDSQDGKFADKKSQSTTWTLTLPAESDSMQTDLSLTRSITSKESNTTITFSPDTVRVRLVRKQSEPDGEGKGNGVDSGLSYIPRSCDPNEMVGPEGVGEARYVKPGEKMTYTVFFENKSEAKAPAQFVTIDNPLNEWLDWSTFQMEDVGFGLQIDTGLIGMKNGTSDATMTGTNLVVRSEVALDEENGVASWFLRIVSPYGDSEGWPYADDPTGFLPPNDPDTHCGEGYVKYSIYVRDDAPAGIVITNSASIVFDYNDPIVTDPAWWNTVATVYKPTIDLGDGTTAEIELIVGQPYGELPTPKARAGYSFAGWYTRPNGTGTKITPETIVQAGDSAIHAYWVKNASPTPPAYTIAFNANAKGVKGKMAAQKIAYGKEVKLNKNKFTRKGYVFAGWAKNTADAKKGIGAYTNAQKVKNLRKDGKTTTLYAVWAKPTYKVAFVANAKGVQGKMTAQTFKYGKAAKLKANKFKAPKGKKFVGWATSAADAKKGKVKYKNKAKVQNLTITGKTLKLYAVWKKR